MVENNFCGDMYLGAYPATIHCMEENDWINEVFGDIHIGLYIPVETKWDETEFRWFDGSKLNFTDWYKKQPNNDIPGLTAEKLVIACKFFENLKRLR